MLASRTRNVVFVLTVLLAGAVLGGVVGGRAMAEGTPPEDSRIRRRVTSVLDDLAGHEEREMDLIQRVFYRDLGAGD